MSTRNNGHAVVIGGSMAGLLTARALSGHFDEVTVIERDQLPEQPDFRKGVPQSRHLHVFWVAGLHTVERMLPGFENELLDAGALPVHLPTDMMWVTRTGLLGGRFAATQTMLSASRTLIEWTVRRAVLRSERIGVVAEHDVTALRLDHAGDVRAVAVRSRRSGTEFDLAADLVVDAGGRGSHLPDWLAAAHRPRPRETRIDAFLGYATRHFTIPAGFDADWKGIFVPPMPPEHLRGGMLLPIEGGRWMVSLIGGSRDYPPTDESGYLEFAASLRDPLLHDAIAGAEPVSPIRGYRQMANHRHHYETLSGMPGKLLSVGDGLCAFNPIYGQGMTVAAHQAETLHRMLPETSTRKVQRALAKVADGAWLIATEQDLGYPAVTGATPTIRTRLTHHYLDRIITAAATSPAVSAAFLRVLNMIDKPSALLRPHVVAALLRRSHDPLPDRPVPETGLPHAGHVGGA
jgi:2-polyprenyl-6-methoxyphenol hydroxylase-like FAD-dependent oxidoreductase